MSQPPPAFVPRNPASPLLVLISAPSGGGKTTLCLQLLARHPDAAALHALRGKVGSQTAVKLQGVNLATTTLTEDATTKSAGIVPVNARSSATVTPRASATLRPASICSGEKGFMLPA